LIYKTKKNYLRKAPHISINQHNWPAFKNKADSFKGWRPPTYRTGRNFCKRR